MNLSYSIVLGCPSVSLSACPHRVSRSKVVVATTTFIKLLFCYFYSVQFILYISSDANLHSPLYFNLIRVTLLYFIQIACAYNYLFTWNIQIYSAHLKEEKLFNNFSFCLLLQAYYIFLLLIFILFLFILNDILRLSFRMAIPV